MKNVIFFTFFFIVSNYLSSQTIYVSNSTACDYAIRIFGSPNSPTTNCSSCNVTAYIPASTSNVAVDLNTGSCGADTYVTMAQVRVQDPCASPTCTSSNTIWVSWSGCNSYPTTASATNSCGAPCLNPSTTVNWVTANSIDIDP